MQGRLSGAIYLAAGAVVPAASSSHIGLLATFAAIVLQSHQAYATLEAAVETRTNQLEQALAHRQTFINAISHEASTRESVVTSIHVTDIYFAAAYAPIRGGRSLQRDGELLKPA